VGLIGKIYKSLMPPGTTRWEKVDNFGMPHRNMNVESGCVGMLLWPRTATLRRGRNRQPLESSRFSRVKFVDNQVGSEHHDF